ncbi:MAG: zinc-binding alcohol dehydrogenase [Alphaproteobacteria bacterium]|nr:zinc-binding alcohol dehydrogenase [Alphaproteobacteria bacterium]
MTETPAPRADLPATTRAFWFDGRGGGSVRHDPLPPLGDGDIAVRTRWSALSRGTEMLVFQGRVPASQAQVMRCPWQEGVFPGPVKYGYMAVGEVVRGNRETSAGQRVFALAPHQDWLVLPTDAAISVPDDVPDERAVLAANMETALNGVWDSGVGPGDRVAVVGAGVVGCLIARLLARMPGVDVTLVDIDPHKNVIARALQIPFAMPDSAPRECDIVFHCSGAGAGLADCLALCGMEAILVEMSWHGTAPVSLPLGEDFHAKRLTIRSSQVGSLPPGRRPRWTHRRRLEKAVALMADPTLDALISHRVGLTDLPKTLKAIAGRELSPLALLIDHTDCA